MEKGRGASIVDPTDEKTEAGDTGFRNEAFKSVEENDDEREVCMRRGGGGEER